MLPVSVRCELAAYHVLLLVFWVAINRLDTTELRLNEQECMMTRPDILSLYQSLINWYRSTEPETVLVRYASVLQVWMYAPRDTTANIFVSTVVTHTSANVEWDIC